jgi:hypothetical protein
VRKVILTIAVLLSFNVSADEQDGVTVLGDEPTELQMQAVRDGAQTRCEDKEEDAREECVMDYFAQHNLEEEPSCD